MCISALKADYFSWGRQIGAFTSKDGYLGGGSRMPVGNIRGCDVLLVYMCLGDAYSTVTPLDEIGIYLL